MPERPVSCQYDDPIKLIWIRAANDLGLQVERSAEVFAAYDGKGTLTIATEDDFDADDCLAQMIFHELCHWLVAGRRGFHLEDWGLSNVDDRDLIYEYSAIRVQAALSRPYGLRDFMAVTTGWRTYWDSLPDDPLADGDDPAIELARNAVHLARLKPFASVLDRSLAATASIADIVREASHSNSLWHRTRPRHRLGALLSQDENQRCGSCAWAIGAAGNQVCRQHQQSDDPLPVKPGEQACEKWETKFTIDDCGACGACCHKGFDVLEIDAKDPFRSHHPELVQIRDETLIVPRPSGKCVALEGQGTEDAPFRCRHYAVRPGNCAEFEVGGEACLTARRRTGLSK